MDQNKPKSSLGLFGATGVGVGAIVGGGILALAGVAFATTGPSAMLAFALNGLIAVLTALSFAELSAKFPESGGTYTFAKKILSVRSAFMIGWVVWFASIVAAVLYAIGFGSFAAPMMQNLILIVSGKNLQWISSHNMVTAFAVGATFIYTLGLIRRAAGGGQWINLSKVVVFIILILGGIWAVLNTQGPVIKNRLVPFFPNGSLGLFQAMGYTFIALQGFDLIAAVAGEVKNPTRNIPRAMLASLGIALAIYLPLLFILATVGVESGSSITEMSRTNPETVVAVAVQHYLGPFGYWLVMAAAIFSMLSALQANLFAASRVARVMGRDRTLSYLLEGISENRGTPQIAILATALIVVTIILVVPDVAGAGAAASLIFLITFALAHMINYLARKRTPGAQSSFRIPLFPLVPVIGGLACMILAIFQGISVPSAGLITVVWLSFGGVLYFTLFSRRAQVVDAAAEAIDPELIKLRGKNPLVLVPIANPDNAKAMVGVANSLAPPGIGRVLLLSIVTAEEELQPGETPRQLMATQSVLRESLLASFSVGLTPEALTTIAKSPWPEIIRVSKIHRCESVLLGFSDITKPIIETSLEELIGRVDSDVVILRAPKNWDLSTVERVLVPVAGRSVHDQLRARILNSLNRIRARQITYLKILSESTSRVSYQNSLRSFSRFASEELGYMPDIVIEMGHDVAKQIMRYAKTNDLVILGLKRINKNQKVFGELLLQIAQNTSCGIIMINRQG